MYLSYCALSKRGKTARQAAAAKVATELATSLTSLSFQSSPGSFNRGKSFRGGPHGDSSTIHPSPPPPPPESLRNPWGNTATSSRPMEFIRSTSSYNLEVFPSLQYHPSQLGNSGGRHNSGNSSSTLGKREAMHRHASDVSSAASLWLRGHQPANQSQYFEANATSQTVRAHQQAPYFAVKGDPDGRLASRGESGSGSGSGSQSQLLWGLPRAWNSTLTSSTSNNNNN